MEVKLVKATVLQDFFDEENRGLVLRRDETIEREEARIVFLASKGLVEYESGTDDDTDTTIENFLGGNGNQVKAFLKTVTVDDLEALKAKLQEEENGSNRAGVKKDIASKIAELESK